VPGECGAGGSDERALAAQRAHGKIASEIVRVAQGLSRGLVSGSGLTWSTLGYRIECTNIGRVESIYRPMSTGATEVRAKMAFR
jgi:hypothetical protein